MDKKTVDRTFALVLVLLFAVFNVLFFYSGIFVDLLIAVIEDPIDALLEEPFLIIFLILGSLFYIIFAFWPIDILRRWYKESLNINESSKLYFKTFLFLIVSVIVSTRVLEYATEGIADIGIAIYYFLMLTFLFIANIAVAGYYILKYVELLD